MLSTVDQKDRVWLAALICLVVFFTSLPYLIGLADGSQQWQFSGFIFGVDDGNSYLAKMLRGDAGEWLFRTPYTAAQQRGIIAYLPYLILGKLTSPPGQHLQLVALYHLYRLVGILFLIRVLYSFSNRFLEETWLKRWALILMVAGGGLGWLAVATGWFDWLEWLPLSFYSPETFGFLAVYGIPHLVFSRGFLIWGLLHILDGKGIQSGLKAGALWIIMALFQPLNMVVGWAVTAGYLLWITWKNWFIREADQAAGSLWKQRASSLLWTWIITAPVIVYYGLLTRKGLSAGWQTQNILFSPGWGEYALAYGLMVPYIAAFLIRRKGNFSEGEWLLICWSALIPLLVNLPVNFQRRLAEGAWLALVILGVKSLEGVADQKKSFWSLGWLLSLPVVLFLLIGGISNAAATDRPIYLPREQIQTFEVLRKDAGPDDVVLSAYATGNALPAWVPVYVVLGHPVETINFQHTEQQVVAYYRGEMNEQEQKQLLQAYSVDYVILGPEERELADDDKLSLVCLDKINGGTYQLFRVTCDLDRVKP